MKFKMIQYLLRLLTIDQRTIHHPKTWLNTCKKSGLASQQPRHNSLNCLDLNSPPPTREFNLAHWTFTQRTIHVAFANKVSVLRHEKQFPARTAGDLIGTQRQEAALTREQLSKATGIPTQYHN
jgi:hypothetical protein